MWVLISLSLCLLLGCSTSTEDSAEPSINLPINDVTYSTESSEGPWQASTFWELPAQPQHLWIRSDLQLEPRHLPTGAPFGVRVSGMASCETRWDGHLLQGLGRPAPRAEDEIPGPISQVLHVPDHLATAGAHRLTLRCSHHHRGFTPSYGYWRLTAGHYGRLLEGERAVSWSALTTLSGMLVVGIYYLVLFVLDRRRRPYLLLSVFSWTAAGMVVAEAWRNVVGYTYDWHIVRLRCVAVLAWGVGCLLLLFLSDQFSVGKSWRLRLAVLLTVSVPIVTFAAWDGKIVGSLLTALVWALLTCGGAWRRKRDGASAAALGVGACLAILLWNPWSFVDRNLYLGLGLLLILLMASHARHLRAEQRQAEATRLRSTRLEIELLRRHLQPHFLMNTLTALSEWVEEEPQVAVHMIEALADEMRLLGDVSQRDRIPFADELELCRHHLDVMGLRRDCRYVLHGETVDDQTTVPPAIFHTLVENAVTHGATAEGGVTELRFVQRRGDNGWTYVFTSPLDTSQVDGSAPHPDGTGLQYIKARLSERYGDAWRFDHGPEGDVWRTVIQIPWDDAHGEGRS